MRGHRAVLFVLAAAMSVAACGTPTFTSADAANRKLPRTEPKTEIGDAAVLDRSSTTTRATTTAPSTPPTVADSNDNYPPGVSHRVVNGVDIIMQTNEAVTFRPGTSVHLVLTITNQTGRAIGYLTNRESHFALVDADNHAVWTDQTCRSADVYNTVPTGYLEIAPGDHVSVDDYYPTHPGTPSTGCRAPAGHAELTGGLTVCFNLAPDWTCRGASDQRVEAKPIAVNVA